MTVVLSRNLAGLYLIIIYPDFSLSHFTQIADASTEHPFVAKVKSGDRKTNCNCFDRSGMVKHNKLSMQTYENSDNLRSTHNHPSQLEFHGELL